MNETEPVTILGNTTRIVMLAMAIVMLAMAVVTVFVVMNERSTQLNADRESAQNEQLQTELQCLREPAFEADRAEARITSAIARGLAAVASGDEVALVDLRDQLITLAEDLEAKFDLREESLTRCTKP